MDKPFRLARWTAVVVVAIGVVQLLFALGVIADVAKGSISRLSIAIVVGAVAEAMRTIATGAILGVLAEVGAVLMDRMPTRIGDDGSWKAPESADVDRIVRGGPPS
jgi:hypothetical protein